MVIKLKFSKHPRALATNIPNPITPFIIASLAAGSVLIPHEINFSSIDLNFTNFKSNLSSINDNIKQNIQTTIDRFNITDTIKKTNLEVITDTNLVEFVPQLPSTPITKEKTITYTDVPVIMPIHGNSKRIIHHIKSGIYKTAYNTKQPSVMNIARKNYTTKVNGKDIKTLFPKNKKRFAFGDMDITIDIPNHEDSWYYSSITPEKYDELQSNIDKLKGKNNSSAALYLINEISKIYDMDNELIKALFTTESSLNPNTSKSPKGAEGISQIMPDTQKTYHIKNIKNFIEAIDGGFRILGRNLVKQNGNLANTLASYNLGPGNFKNYPNVKETREHIIKTYFSLPTQYREKLIKNSNLSNLAFEDNYIPETISFPVEQIATLEEKLMSSGNIDNQLIYDEEYKSSTSDVKIADNGINGLLAYDNKYKTTGFKVKFSDSLNVAQSSNNTSNNNNSSIEEIINSYTDIDVVEIYSSDSFVNFVKTFETYDDTIKDSILRIVTSDSLMKNVRNSNNPVNKFAQLVATRHIIVPCKERYKKTHNGEVLSRDKINSEKLYKAIARNLHIMEKDGRMDNYRGIIDTYLKHKTTISA